MNDKSRVTLYVCTSAAGERVPLSMIGKSKNPFVLRECDSHMEYFSQKNAWSDGDTFQKWFDKVFLPFVRAKGNAKVYLLMDNHNSHVPEDPMKQVELIMLPPNSTSRRQPMDAGIISNLKTNYRYQLLDTTIKIWLNTSAPCTKERRSGWGHHGLHNKHSANILDAMELSDIAWDLVKQSSIVRCWLKTGALPLSTADTLRELYGKEFKTRDTHDICDLISRMSSMLLNVKADHGSSNIEDLQSIVQNDPSALKVWADLENIPDVQEYAMQEAAIELMNDEAAKDTGVTLKTVVGDPQRYIEVKKSGANCKLVYEKVALRNVSQGNWQWKSPSTAHIIAPSTWYSVHRMSTSNPGHVVCSLNDLRITVPVSAFTTHEDITPPLINS